MRRPAQHHLGPVAAAWAHPYHGVAGLSVFYNSAATVDPNAAPAPAPTPADLAARAGQQPPAQTPPATVPAADPDDEKVAFTQRRLNKMMSEEKDEGRRAAYRTIAEAAGLDPDTFDPNQFGEIFKQAEQARQQQLSEEQRRTEELQRREQAIQTSQATVAQEQERIAEERRALARETALIRLGAVDVTDDQGQLTTPNLQDALAMLERDLRESPDADPAAVATAAEALKKRRPELFGTAAPQTLPPAPSGGPASGNSPRPASASGKDAVKQEARKWADQLGYGRRESA
ncbi:hypothetical protein P1P75_12025 [Streptomyces sp. ID05-39B]|uniref:hypothetical protein n=1 Tax=Streptomyces sp. ID05-39B TaxID=3028664 RepID=UPI0029AF384F|nr:hypothetical protein [Streptomyces sp. ID05-39B]MDX3527151.1 hypothetical protein [Streptomyces sp. ID05-39B]